MGGSFFEKKKTAAQIKQGLFTNIDIPLGSLNWGAYTAGQELHHFFFFAQQSAPHIFMGCKNRVSTQPDFGRIR